MRPGGLTVVSGGAPTEAQLAALTAALAALVEDEGRAPADPVPAAYRSRWRRAALLEASAVPAHLKDDNPAWGAH